MWASLITCRRGVGGDRRWNAPLHEAHSDRSAAPRRPLRRPAGVCGYERFRSCAARSRRPRSSSPVTRSDGATRTPATTRSSRRPAPSPHPCPPRPHLLVHLRRRRELPLPRRAPPRVTGTVRVAGAPPALTLATSLPQISYGAKVILSGQVNNKRAGEQVRSSTNPTARPRSSTSSPPSSPARTAPSTSPRSRRS